MTHNRIKKDTGFVKLAKLPKGQNGRALCRQCGVEVPKGRRSYCSDACVHEWRIKSDPGYLRAQVKLRDAGVCAQCGVDTVTLMSDLSSLANQVRKERTVQLSQRYRARVGELIDQGYRSLSANGFYLTEGMFWQADHIIPVAEGGGECGLDNIRTLCTPCHKAATAALRQRLAQRNDKAFRKQKGGDR